MAFAVVTGGGTKLRAAAAGRDNSGGGREEQGETDERTLAACLAENASARQGFDPAARLVKTGADYFRMPVFGLFSRSWRSLRRLRFGFLMINVPLPR